MTNEIQSIIVDDEQGAREVLESLLQSFCPKIKVMATCADLKTAVEEIKRLKPQLVFLDIEMPNYAGYEISKFFDCIDFEIIFVTAYDNYAVKAFELAALDYLLKPIDVERLQKACLRVENQMALKTGDLKIQALEQNLSDSSSQKMVIKDKGHDRIISIKNIIAIEANEAYSNIHMISEENILVSKNLKHFERVLEGDICFFRTHKSWIVNTRYLENTSVLKPEIQIKGGVVAKLSRYKKASFKTLLMSL